MPMRALVLFTIYGWFAVRFPSLNKALMKLGTEVLLHSPFRKRVERGMENMLGRREPRLIKENMRFLLQLVESFFFLRYHPKGRRILEEGTELYGEQHLRQILEEGRGAILVSAHMGNFLWAFNHLAQRFPVNVVIRRFKNPLLERLLSEALELAGIRRIFPEGAALRVKTALRQGQVVAFLVDQYLLSLSSKRRSEALKKVISRLSSSLKVPIVPFFVSEAEGGKVVGELRPPLWKVDMDVIRKMVTEEIRRQPHLWLWWWRLGKKVAG